MSCHPFSHDTCRPIGQAPALLGATAAMSVALFLSGPGCAAPLNCAWRQTPTAEAAPSAGDGIVSVDSLVWLHVDPVDGETRCLTTSVSLVDLDEGPVDVTRTLHIESPGRILDAWRPTAPLRPEADHELVWSATDGTTAASRNGVVSFRTGPADFVAPSPLPPTPLAWFANTEGPRLGVDAADAVDYDDELELWLDGGRFVLMQPADAVDEGSDAPPADVFRLGARGYIWSVEPLPAGRTVDYRFASLELDGTLSPWGEAVSLPLPFPGYADSGDFE